MKGQEIGKIGKTHPTPIFVWKIKVGWGVFCGREFKKNNTLFNPKSLNLLTD